MGSHSKARLSLQRVPANQTIRPRLPIDDAQRSSCYHTLARTWRSRAILVSCVVSWRGLKCLVRGLLPLIVVKDGGNTAHAPEEGVQHGWRPRAFRKRPRYIRVRVRAFHAFRRSNISGLFTWIVGFPKSQLPNCISTINTGIVPHAMDRI